MEFKLAELAEHVGAELVGDGQTIIRSAATLEKAGSGDISFLANEKYVGHLETTSAGAVVVSKGVNEAACPLLVSDDPYFAFRQILILMYGHRKHKQTGVSERASVAGSAKIGKNCHIQDFAVVADNAEIGDNTVIYPGVFVGEYTKIGADCVLYPNVTVYDRCVIGDRVNIGANAIVGEDGFGYATHKGEHHKIPHIGRVIIEDDVEIGAGCGIERGTLDDTVIGLGAKLGDLIAIGHGAKVGPHCLLVAQVGIAGSTSMGHHCVLGGQVGVVGHIKIGNMVRIAAQAGVINDVPDGSEIVGAPAIDSGKGRRAYSLIGALPDMRQSLRAIEKRLAKLEKEQA